MRALCGAIITAGALIGLGLTAIGVGTRYQQYPRVDANNNPSWVYFHQMDTALITICVVLFCTLVVGVALAIIGLAYHHHRRHHEMFGRGTSATETRHPVG
jgi:hypothetical protein